MNMRIINLLILFVSSTFSLADENKITRELDAYWAEVSRCVGEGDFQGYQATVHPEGILVSGSKKSSQPLAQALARWKTEFDQTKAGTMKASVEFRFSQRFHDTTTAHETGIFRYTSQQSQAEPKVEYIHFTALLTKKTTWVILMENQIKPATAQEWEQLASPTE